MCITVKTCQLKSDGNSILGQSIIQCIYMAISIIGGKSQDDAIYRSLESTLNIKKRKHNKESRIHVFYLLAFGINMCLH